MVGDTHWSWSNANFQIISTAWLKTRIGFGVAKIQNSFVLEDIFDTNITFGSYKSTELSQNRLLNLKKSGWEVVASINNSKIFEKSIRLVGQFVWLNNSFIQNSFDMKVRVSHFVTKNIEVNEITKPIPKITNIKTKKSTKSKSSSQKVAVVKKIQTTTTKKPPTGIKLERILLRKESEYASIPKPEQSDIINKIIDKEVTVFRSV